jgi:hypothetical protein
LKCLISSQTSETHQDFQDNLERLQELLLDVKSDPLVQSDCPCTRSQKRTTRCLDCSFYGVSCNECFIDAHRNLPTHWAEVWDVERGFFIRHDISSLRSQGYATHLGHHGACCPSADKEVLFILVDTNGIHNTKFCFCNCAGAPDRVEQLMRVRMFPATMRRPTMAFTFNLLHQFHLHHLESKASAYDFIGALRRITDNAFAKDTPVGLNTWQLNSI